MLTGTMDTKAYGCITNCLYETKAKPNMKFCFAPGDLEVECLDDGSSKPPKGDSTKPPKEETSKPPMDGSSKPPMEGSSKPPMDKTSKPPMEETSKPPMDESTKPPMGSSSEKPGQLCIAHYVWFGLTQRSISYTLLSMVWGNYYSLGQSKKRNKEDNRGENEIYLKNEGYE